MQSCYVIETNSKVHFKRGHLQAMCMRLLYMAKSVSHKVQIKI